MEGILEGLYAISDKMVSGRPLLTMRFLQALHKQRSRRMRMKRTMMMNRCIQLRETVA